jgi:8-amino-7-oxononanoate synthase
MMRPCCMPWVWSRCRFVNAIAVKMQERIFAELAELESRAELRQLETVRGINLGSNDYLGLSTDPRMKQAVGEALEAAPRVASTGSRLLSGHDDVWTALENEFARWMGAEAALYFSSGYAANMGLLSAILHPEDVVFSDSANHASLIDGIRLTKCKRLIFPHLDLNALEAELRWTHSASGGRFIVVESIFSMDGERAPLQDLASLAARYDAQLIVDEAHATGVCGPDGRGAVAEAGLSGRLFATVHTCGKALAAAGAFVCGSQALRRFLINRARTFIYNTALPPYFAAQVSAGMHLAAAAETERRLVAGLGIFLRNGLQANGFDTAGSDSHLVPTVLGSNEVALAFVSQLQTRGFGIRAIRPPTVPTGTARLRVSLTAKLTEGILADFVGALIQIRKEVASAQAIPLPR